MTQSQPVITFQLLNIGVPQVSYVAGNTTLFIIKIQVLNLVNNMDIPKFVIHFTIVIKMITITIIILNITTIVCLGGVQELLLLGGFGGFSSFLSSSDVAP